MIRDAYLESAQTAAILLRQPALADRWSQPSALPDFSTGGLARHLANQITHTVTYLDGEPGRTAIPLLDHFTGNAWVVAGVDGESNVGIRRRSERAAAETGPAELTGVVDTALATLRVRVPAEPADRIIDFGDWGLAIDDFLATRVLELVVHVDDLAVSLDLPTPKLPPAATEAAIALLSRIAAWRHGPVAVLRALSRQERAPASIAAL